jgi:hypothetical protein
MVQDRRRENAQLKVVGGDGTQYASEKTVIRTPIGTLRIPSWVSRKPLIFILACGVLVGIMKAQPFDREEESNCLAMLMFCTILWATEVRCSASFCTARALIGYPAGYSSFRHQFLRSVLDRSVAHDQVE